MRFFLTRHFSTAKKIIEGIEKKIIHDVELEPNDEVDYIHMINKNKLIQILGTVLEGAIADPLYNKYQKLPSTEKNALRNEMIDAYYASLKSCTMNFQKLDIRINIVANDPYHMCGQRFVDINLPEIFHNKDMLTLELRAALSEMRETLCGQKAESQHGL